MSFAYLVAVAARSLAPSELAIRSGACMVRTGATSHQPPADVVAQAVPPVDAHLHPPVGRMAYRQPIRFPSPPQLVANQAHRDLDRPPRLPSARTRKCRLQLCTLSRCGRRRLPCCKGRRRVRRILHHMPSPVWHPRRPLLRWRLRPCSEPFTSLGPLGLGVAGRPSHPIICAIPSLHSSPCELTVGRLCGRC